MISKVMVKSFLVNLCLTALKLLGSFFSHSLVLMGDAVHCLSDMLTDIIGLLGSFFANKKPDKKHPYGYGKVEYLTSIIISIFIISLGITIIINSIKSPLKITSPYALIVIILSIIIKFTLSKYLLKKGSELNSTILKTNGIESKYDAFSSLFAFLFVILSLFGSVNKIFLYADLLGSILISFLTLKIGIKLLLENISCILGEIETDGSLLNTINELVKKHKIVTNIKEIKLLKYGSYYKLNIELEMLGSISLNEIYIVESKIKEELKSTKLNIKYITINASPYIENTLS